MNAHEMYETLMKRDPCVGLSEWLRDTVMPLMSRARMVAHINSERVRWPREDFIYELEQLGYEVTYRCDDHPSSQPYYTISLNVFSKVPRHPPNSR